MSPDDIGGLAGQTAIELRARQNVIFELGFFIGALGRGCVAILHKKGAAFPSDLFGVCYIDFDESGGWKLPLGSELSAAGLSVDLNACLK